MAENFQPIKPTYEVTCAVVNITINWHFMLRISKKLTFQVFVCFLSALSEQICLTMSSASMNVAVHS